MRRRALRSLPFLAALLLLGGAGILAAFVWFNPSIGLFILSNVAALFILLIFGVLGGAFVGMIVAHRMASERQFSPFERQVLQSLSDLRATTERLEKVEATLLERLDEIERKPR